MEIREREDEGEGEDQFLGSCRHKGIFWRHLRSATERQYMDLLCSCPDCLWKDWDYGVNGFHVACGYNSRGEVISFLEGASRFPVVIREFLLHEDSFAYIPLTWACEQGHTEIVALLCDYNVCMRRKASSSLSLLVA